MNEAIDALLRPEPGFSCLLLVCADTARLRARAESIAQSKGWPVFSVGAAVAPSLRRLPIPQRPLEVRRVLEAALSRVSAEPVVCVDIDLLFDPSLQTDPLVLFAQEARKKRLVVAWPGSCLEGLLSYAVPEHRHFQTWRDIPAQVRCVELF